MHLYVIIRFICSFGGIHDCLVPVRQGYSFAYQEQASAKGEGCGYESCTPDPSVSPGRTPHRGDHVRSTKEEILWHG